MTEIPEHLLKRSKERRAALGLPGGEGGGDSGSGGDAAPAASDAPATPAKAAAPAPAKVEDAPPPPPKPKPEYIQAAERRKRIPYWAMPVIALLPVWALVYADSMTVPPESDEQLTIGEEIFTGSCQGCHGPAGGGTSAGAQLNDGEVLKTFPDPVAMMEWIHLGADEWVGGPSGPYGDPDRDPPRDAADIGTPMPQFAALDPLELAGVTRYVRENLSGEAPASPEVQELYEEWAALAIENAEAGEVIYRDVEPGTEGDERISLVTEG